MREKRSVRSVLDTRNKLEEARYFLKEFLRTQNRIESGRKSDFYLSAFLSAWRSVLDVMLYDFAEYYSIGLTRENKMFSRDFWLVSKVQGKEEALKFLDWWNRKRAKLEKNELWYMRHMIVHRGYPETSELIYVPPSLSSSTATGYNIPDKEHALFAYIDASAGKLYVEYSDLPDKCKEAFDMIEIIVDEAEKDFKVSLK